MTVKIPEDWPEWPQDGLENLGKCPVCDSPKRILLYRDLIDRQFGAPGRWTMYLCDGCGSGYLDPRPNKATIGLAYANYETHRSAAASPVRVDNRFGVRLRNGYLNTKYGYQMQPSSRWGYLAMHLLPPPWRLEWDHFARHLPRPAPGCNKLLDVGCGNGEFLLRAQWQGWDVHGIDFDAKALQHATEAGIPVVAGEVAVEKFDPSSFDAITSHQVLEHMHEPSRLLSILRAWLKPSGTIWLGTPNIGSGLHKEYGADWYPLHPPQHLVIFSSGALMIAMQSAGFTGIKFLPRGFYESHICRASKIIHTSNSHSIYKEIASTREESLSFAQQLLLEMRVWANSCRGSDFVIIGRKC